MGNKVQVSMSEKEFEMVKHWAETKGVNMAQFGREAMFAKIPYDMKVHFLGKDNAGPSDREQRASAHAEKVEELYPGSIKEQLDNSPMDTSHTCQWIRTLRIPANGECRGTCAFRGSMGKACHWAAGCASSCEYFRPQRMG